MQPLPVAAMAPSPRCVPRDTGRDTARARQRVGTGRADGGSWVVPYAAGSQLGPWRLQGPGTGRVCEAQPQSSPSARPRCPSPVWHGGHGSWRLSPVGSPLPLSQADPCGARAMDPAPASPRERRRGEAGAAARWSRLRTAIFLGGEGWGEMDALMCGGATAGNVTEGRRAAGAGAEPIPVPSPVPVLVPAAFGPRPWSGSSLVGAIPGHLPVSG